MKKILIPTVLIIIVILTIGFFFFREDSVNKDGPTGYRESIGPGTIESRDSVGLEEGNTEDFVEHQNDVAYIKNKEDEYGEYGEVESNNSDTQTVINIRFSDTGMTLINDFITSGITNNINPISSYIPPTLNTSTNNYYSNYPDLDIFDGNIPTSSENKQYLINLAQGYVDNSGTADDGSGDSVDSGTNDDSSNDSDDNNSNDSGASNNSSGSGSSDSDDDDDLLSGAPTSSIAIDKAIEVIREDPLYEYNYVAQAHIYLYELNNSLIFGTEKPKFGATSAPGGGSSGSGGGLFGGGSSGSSGSGGGGTSGGGGGASSYFGGRILQTITCTCSSNTLVYIQDTVTKSVLPLVYQPGVTRLYSNYNIYTSGVQLIGSYTPGAGMCQIYVGTSCTTKRSDGMMNSVPGVGTSQTPGS